VGGTADISDPRKNRCQNSRQKNETRDTQLHHEFCGEKKQVAVALQEGTRRSNRARSDSGRCWVTNFVQASEATWNQTKLRWGFWLHSQRIRQPLAPKCGHPWAEEMTTNWVGIREDQRQR